MPTTLLCHFCEFDTTNGEPHDCPFIGLGELEKRLVDAAIYSLCGSGSITSECHRDAAILLLTHARKTGKECIDRAEAYRLLDIAYQYFERNQSLPAVTLPPELNTALYHYYPDDNDEQC